MSPRRSVHGVLALVTALALGAGLSACATPNADPPAAGDVAMGRAASGEQLAAGEEATPAPAPTPDGAEAAGTADETAAPNRRAPAGVHPSLVDKRRGSGPVPNAADRLRTLPAATTQVIVVSAGGWGTSYGTLEAFRRDGDRWVPAFPAMPARLGAQGFSDNKTESDMTTPIGMYSIGTTMYGIKADPGVRYGYHRLVDGDWWNENPASPAYNTFQHGTDPGGNSEALWRIAPQYHYFAVINYNIPVQVADPPRGSGIFLHVMTGSTAGCVAVSEANLISLLRWLDPAASPRIVMAPASELDRY